MVSKFINGKGVIICLYVNDILIFGTDPKQVQDTKALLSSCFVVKNLSVVNVILGIKIIRDNDGLILTQSYYI